MEKDTNRTIQMPPRNVEHQLRSRNDELCNYAADLIVRMRDEIRELKAASPDRLS